MCVCACIYVSAIMEKWNEHVFQHLWSSSEGDQNAYLWTWNYDITHLRYRIRRHRYSSGLLLGLFPLLILFGRNRPSHLLKIEACIYSKNAGRKNPTHFCRFAYTFMDGCAKSLDFMHSSLFEILPRYHPFRTSRFMFVPLVFVRAGCFCPWLPWRFQALGPIPASSHKRSQHSAGEILPHLQHLQDCRKRWNLPIACLRFSGIILGYSPHLQSQQQSHLPYVRA